MALDPSVVTPEHPELEHVVLGNGFQAHLLPAAVPKDRIQLYLEVKAGSVDEEEHEQGIAHYVEHAVFLGTSKFKDSEEIKKLLASMGMSFGGDSNAFTDFRQTVYTLNVAFGDSGAQPSGAAEEHDSPKVTPAKGAGAAAGPEDQAPPSPPTAFSPSWVGCSHTSTRRCDHPAAGPLLPLPGATLAKRAGGRTTRKSLRRDEDAARASALAAALELLYEMMFEATFPETAIDTERGAVLSELQMRNTVDYRSEVKFMQQLHHGTPLPHRFPIGRQDQIEKWTRDDLMAFWRKHYHPANMALYVVGPLGDVGALKALLHSTFGGASPSPSPPLRTAIRPPPPAPQPKGKGRKGAAPAEADQATAAAIEVFQDPLVTQFSLSISATVPRAPVTNVAGQRLVLVDTIIRTALDARLDAIQQAESAAPFLQGGWDYNDTFRDDAGTMAISLTSSEPEGWRDAVAAVVAEVQRMAAHGLAEGEFHHCMEVVMRESMIDAEQAATARSGDIIEDLLDAHPMGEVYMDKREEHELVSEIADDLTLGEINVRAGEVFRFVGVLGAAGPGGAAPDPSSPPRRDTQGLAGPEGVLMPSPTYVFVGAPAECKSRPFKVDPADVLAAIAGAWRVDVPPPAPWDVPAELVPRAVIDAMHKAQRPKYLTNPLYHLHGVGEEGGEGEAPAKRQKAAGAGRGGGKLRAVDSATGVTQMMLSNGIALTYKVTDFEAEHCALQLTWSPAGRALEAPEEAGAISLGLDTLLGGGAAGHSAEMVNKYAAARAVEMTGGASSEKLFLGAECSVSEGGLDAACEILLAFMHMGEYERSAFERAKRDHRIGWEAGQRDLDVLAGTRMSEVVADDHRFRQVTPELLGKISLEQCKEACKSQLRATQLLEVTVVGAFRPPELEACVLRYFGGVPRAAPPTPLPPPRAGRADRVGAVGIKWCPPKGGEPSKVHLPEESDRAVALMVLPACNRFGLPPAGASILYPSDSGGGGSAGEGGDGGGGGGGCLSKAAWGDAAMRRAHPLFFRRAMNLVQDALDARLTLEIRERLGLVYSIACSWHSYEVYDHGLLIVQLTPHPDKLAATCSEVRNVMTKVLSEGFTRAEVEDVLGPLVASGRTQMTSSNSWWMAMMVGLGSRHVPRHVEWIRDTLDFYSSMTTDDVNYALARMVLPPAPQGGVAGGPFLWEVTAVGGGAPAPLGAAP